MPLPQFRTLDGDLVALRWTRLKPASEVQAVVPLRPEPRWRDGLVFGPERVKEIGAGFDKRTVFVRPVIADDGMYQVMGRTIRGRPQTGVAVKYEPDRAWTPADLGHAEAQAVAILKAHDFPVDYEWPKPGAWAWSGEDDLWWAEAPEEGGALVFEDGREDAGMSGVLRGDLGWPDTGSPQDPRAAERWPRFSAFGWALEITELRHFQHSAKANFVTRLAQAMLHADVKRLAGSIGEDLDFDVERLAGSIGEDLDADVERLASLIGHDLDHIWRLGFSLGGYLAEHRIRNAHGDMLGRGETNRDRTAAGAATTNAQAKAKAEVRRKIALKTAQEAMTSGDLPEGYSRWSREAIVQALRDTWPDKGTAPSAATLRGDLKKLLSDGELKLSR